MILITVDQKVKNKIKTSFVYGIFWFTDSKIDSVVICFY